MSQYQVIVSNVGEVLRTTNRRDAIGTYRDYIIRSQSNRGRCAGQSVTLLQDDDILQEYIGTQVD